MKARTITVAVVVLLAGFGFATAVEAATINGRQARQQARIGRGIASGALTPREAVRLERREAAIARQERCMRATGGVLTRRERAALNTRLNRLSRDIRRQTHDRQRRW
jgi:hypothetical protein